MKNSASDWINRGSNIWEYNKSLGTNDVGNLILNSTGDYTFGYRYQYTTNMTTQGDYVSNTSGTATLYLYSTSNPATAYPNGIEVIFGPEPFLELDKEAQSRQEQESYECPIS